MSINDLGTAVGQYVDSQGLFHGFIYTADGNSIPVPDAITGVSDFTFCSFWGINNRGNIVGSATGDFLPEDGYHLPGFVLRDGNYNLFEVPVPDIVATWPNGINDLGTVVGYYHTTVLPVYLLHPEGNEHGFIRQGNTYTTLDVPDPDSDAAHHVVWTQALGINNAGQIVGGYGTADGNWHGFLLSKGVNTTYDFPNTVVNTLTGINDHSEVTGVYNFYNNAYFGTMIPQKGGH